MNAQLENVLNAALSMSQADQIELIEALLAAQQNRAEGQVLNDEWIAEIRRRSAEYDAGSVVPIPWEFVRG